MLRALLAPAAMALLAAAQSPRDPAPSPQPAHWASATLGENRVLRGATAQHPGDRIIFLCNNERRLVAMLFRLNGDPDAVARAVASGHWLLDGAAEVEADPRPIIPAGPHVISLVRVEPALYRRLLEARAAGFAWTGADGTRLAAYQLDMSTGHAGLAEFARACDSEAYR